MIIIGASAGFTFRYVGLDGRSLRAALIADSTSRVAASMLRLRTNCRVTPVWPSVLWALISETPAIRLNSRSRGVATDEAMISGLAPGSEAETEMVGKSTCGSGETGRNGKATSPVRATAAVSNVVATGL